MSAPIAMKEASSPLSPSESALLEPSHRNLKTQLDAQEFEAAEMVRWHEDKLRSYILSPPPWEYVRAYADWMARLALARDRLDRMFPGAF